MFSRQYRLKRRNQSTHVLQCKQICLCLLFIALLTLNWYVAPEWLYQAPENWPSSSVDLLYNEDEINIELKKNRAN